MWKEQLMSTSRDSHPFKNTFSNSRVKDCSEKSKAVRLGWILPP